VPEGGRGCFSRVEGSVRAMGGGDGDGSGQEEGESNTVTSLDLSDCSDEVRWERRRDRQTFSNAALSAPLASYLILSILSS